MGTLTVQFVGICTHITLQQPHGATTHRVVMVHAEVGAFMETLWIPPHRTFLMINPTTILAANVSALDSLDLQNDGNWQLLGTRLSVKDGIGKVEYGQGMDQVPSLLELTPDFGALSDAVVFGPNAAAHFEVSSGTYTAAPLAGGSWCATLQIETNTDEITLELQDLGSTNTGTLTFKSGATIVVSNTGGRQFDKRWDFLLHYLTAQTFPPDAKYPVSRIDEPLGPGCSNSQFP